MYSGMKAEGSSTSRYRSLLFMVSSSPWDNFLGRSGSRRYSAPGRMLTAIFCSCRAWFSSAVIDRILFLSLSNTPGNTCGVATMVCIPSSRAMRAIASDSSLLPAPSSRPGRIWVCMSIIFGSPQLCNQSRVDNIVNCCKYG